MNDKIRGAHDAALQIIDTSIVRVHHHGACINRNRRQSMRRSRGGLISKIHAVSVGNLIRHGSPDLCWPVSLVQNTVKALTIVKPDTAIRWLRAGLGLCWRCKLPHGCGRPAVPLEMLISEMKIANRCGERQDRWRASQARHRPDQRRQVHGAEEGPSLAGMEDVPSEPCGWHYRNGPLRRDDDFIPAALWFADHGPWPAADPVVWDHRAHDDRLDCQSAH